jgi:hypothetical protein
VTQTLIISTNQDIIDFDAPREAIEWKNEVKVKQISNPSLLVKYSEFPVVFLLNLSCNNEFLETLITKDVNI